MATKAMFQMEDEIRRALTENIGHIRYNVAYQTELDRRADQRRADRQALTANLAAAAAVVSASAALVAIVTT